MRLDVWAASMIPIGCPMVGHPAKWGSRKIESLSMFGQLAADGFCLSIWQLSGNIETAVRCATISRRLANGRAWTIQETIGFVALGVCQLKFQGVRVTWGADWLVPTPAKINEHSCSP